MPHQQPPNNDQPKVPFGVGWGAAPMPQNAGHPAPYPSFSAQPPYGQQQQQQQFQPYPPSSHVGAGAAPYPTMNTPYPPQSSPYPVTSNVNANASAYPTHNAYHGVSNQPAMPQHHSQQNFNQHANPSYPPAGGYTPAQGYQPSSGYPAQTHHGYHGSPAQGHGYNQVHAPRTLNHHFTANKEVCQ